MITHRPNCISTSWNLPQANILSVEGPVSHLQEKSQTRLSSRLSCYLAILNITSIATTTLDLARGCIEDFESLDQVSAAFSGHKNRSPNPNSIGDVSVCTTVLAIPSHINNSNPFCSPSFRRRFEASMRYLTLLI